MTDTYNKVAGALDESRALLAEVMAELTAAAEREQVLREALREALAITEGRQAGTYDDIMRAARAALEATS